MDAIGLESSAREEADPKATPLQVQWVSWNARNALGLESSAREEADPRATPLQMQRAFVAEAFLQQVGWGGAARLLSRCMCCL